MKNWSINRFKSVSSLAVKRKEEPEEWAEDTEESFIFVVRMEILQCV